MWPREPMPMDGLCAHCGGRPEFWVSIDRGPMRGMCQEAYNEWLNDRHPVKLRETLDRG